MRIRKPGEDRHAGFTSHHERGWIFRRRSVTAHDGRYRHPHLVSAKGMLDVRVLEDFGSRAGRSQNIARCKCGFALAALEKVLGKLVTEASNLSLLQRIGGAYRDDSLVQLI